MTFISLIVSIWLNVDSFKSSSFSIWGRQKMASRNSHKGLEYFLLYIYFEKLKIWVSLFYFHIHAYKKI
jgi:hypothetical protein